MNVRAEAARVSEVGLLQRVHGIAHGVQRGDVGGSHQGRKQVVKSV